MSLRRQSLSPTANLLRNSRLFSLPKPLPLPNVTDSGSARIQASETATRPYPTHQAIATTSSSLARGDWGLKRAIPSRSFLVQTSNPVLRIKHWDTIEHITDFESAGDHVRTRQKFEQMGIPMLRGTAQMSETDLTATAPKSAFESSADITTYEEDTEGIDGTAMYLEALQQNVVKNTESSPTESTPTDPAKSNETSRRVPFNIPHYALQRPNRRWKHEGPWLPGMSAEDFTAYVSKELSKRRKEFNSHLIEYVKGEIYTRRSMAARQNEDLPLDADEAEAYRVEKEKEWSSISDSDIEAGIQNLRAQCAVDPLASNLVQKLIIPFLRLPPIKLKSTMYAQDTTNLVDGWKFSDDTTPNSTHPSGGLGYLRTNAHLSNHPILGPQNLPEPVTGRIIQARRTRIMVEPYAKVGVGGFVANDEFRNATVGFRQTTTQDVEKLDIDTPGGAKLFVQPQYGSIAPDGRVHLKVKRSYGPELAVSRGVLDDKPPVRENFEARPLDNLNIGSSGVPELDAQSEDKANNFFKALGQMQQSEEHDGGQQRNQKQRREMPQRVRRQPQKQN